MQSNCNDVESNYSLSLIMLVFESAGITHIGRKRKVNEDSLFLDDDLGLYLVADGMGGHRAGEVASNLAVETIRDYIKKVGEDPNTQEFGKPDEALSTEANRLLSGIKLSNRVVHQASKSNESYHGMGSTISAIYFNDDTFIAANVGDSPIYFVHNGSIDLLSVPHTVIAEHTAIDAESAGQLGPEFYHMLTQAIGSDETVRPDICEIQHFKDDILIISSDGLSNNVSPEEILDAVKNKYSETACQYLVDLANERGGNDNITAIVIKIKKAKLSVRGIKGFIQRFLEGLYNFTLKKY